MERDASGDGAPSAWAREAVPETDYEAIARALAHRKSDPHLDGVRDGGALSKLPIEEREAWRALWEEVEALLMKAGS